MCNQLYSFKCLLWETIFLKFCIFRLISTIQALLSAKTKLNINLKAFWPVFLTFFIFIWFFFNKIEQMMVDANITGFSHVCTHLVTDIVTRRFLHHTFCSPIFFLVIHLPIMILVNFWKSSFVWGPENHQYITVFLELFGQPVPRNIWTTCS